MNYKILLIIFCLFFNSCSTIVSNKSKPNFKKLNNFTNKGFTLIYSDDLFLNKTISKKINDRDLIIFQKNLKKDTIVKIKNISNNKVILAKVGVDANYPIFNNSVISDRIAKEIELNIEDPYVEIFEILDNSLFIAKRAKTYDEEKKVANTAPVDSISISDLSKKPKNTKISKKKEFEYLIKIADFYYKNTAESLLSRIKNEIPKVNVSLLELSNTQYRLFSGPFYNINALQDAFNSISVLEFENIEIIKNEKN